MSKSRFSFHLRAWTFVAILVLPLLTFADQTPTPTQRPLTHNDYDSWRSLRDQTLSRDGKYLAYGVGPVEGESDLVIRDLAVGREQRFPLGYRGAVAAAEGAPAPAPAARGGRGGAGGGGAAPAGRLQFTADSKTVITPYGLTKAEQIKARGSRGKAGAKVESKVEGKVETKVEPQTEPKAEPKAEAQPTEELPRTGIALIDVASGKVTKLERVRGFLLAENSSEYLVYQREPAPGANPPGEGQEGERGGQPPARGGAKGGGKGGGRRGGAGAAPANQVQGGGGRGRQFGSDLIVRRLADGHEQTIPEVVEYSLSKDGRLLVYTVSSRTKDESNGVYAVAPGDPEPSYPVLAGKGRYQRLTWDREQMQLAFLSDRDDAAATQPKLKIYLWSRPITEPAAAGSVKNNGEAASADAPAVKRTAVPQPAVEILSNTAPGFRNGWVVSDGTGLSFSRDGRKMFFNTAPAPKPPAPPPAEGEAREAKITVELWHFRDDFIQPMQRIRGGQDQSRTFPAVVHLSDRHFVQLADETLPSVTNSAAGDFAVGSNDKPYRIEVGYDTTYADYYVVNQKDGSRKQVLTHHNGGLSFSTGGRYMTYFDGKDWNAINVATGAVANLTRGFGVPLTREDHDTPNAAPSHGLAGWAKDDQTVLINDRYDIWQVNPDGTGAKNLTGGAGRRDQTQLRLTRLDQSTDDAALDLTKPLLLHAVNERTRDTGFFRLRPESRTPELLVMAGRSFGNPVKAKDSDTVMLTSTTFYDAPELYVTTTDFREMGKVTDTNPQKAELAWGKAELINYTNSDGVPLKGILVKPGGFQPGKKYPMMVYIYERLSQGLHNFHAPAAGTSINTTFYASNGYLVLMPDIAYTVGHPGQSALKCVLPAIQTVADMGILDEKAIGIQGHSWGGYQIAYMVTQTNRFKAAAAGAPVSNMVSAYDGIRWGTGLPRQFQYEKTQSRIGGTIWDVPTLFLENSPIFHANRVQTPLMMLHNDQDDAVPWYQGIEYYLALRRLGKEVYMFNYPGERHGLGRRENQRDYTVRMQQFFDHNLKGAPKPEWMEKGIPYSERERPPGK